jgi:hypothetical protein
MVTILVGKDETPFVLHRATLFRKSSYFRKGLSLDQDQGDDDEMKPARLPEIEVRYYKVYTHWVCSSQLDIGLLGCRMTTDQRPGNSAARHASEAQRDAQLKAQLDNGAWSINDLMRLWADGDFLGDVEFQNIVSDELVKWLLHYEHCLTGMPVKAFAFVDTHTDSECPLRQILIDWADLELTNEKSMKLLSATAPKWSMTGLLLNEIRREGGDWQEDPRASEGRKKERYHVRQMAEA